MFPFTAFWQVYAIDLQGDPELQGKVPITNVRIIETGFIVQFVTEYSVSGGTIGNATFSEGNAAAYVNFQILGPDGEEIDNIVSKVPIPGLLYPIVGAGGFIQVAETVLESTLFGTGSAYFLTRVTPIDADSNFASDSRVTLKFDGTVANPVCDNVGAAASRRHRGLETLRRALATSCDTPYDGHRVLQGFAGIHGTSTNTPDPVNPYTGNLFPIDSERNTLEYRQAAFDFFQQRYGLTFDPSLEGVQPILGEDGMTPALLMIPFRTPIQVYAADFQGSDMLAGKLPMTNLRNEDDGFIVFVTQFYNITGGTIGDVTLFPGILWSYGEYRFMTDDGAVVDTFTVTVHHPAVTQFVPGSTTDTRTVINAVIEHPMYGTGDFLALQSNKAISMTDLAVDIRYVVNFEGDFANKVCDNIGPVATIPPTIAPTVAPSIDPAGNPPTAAPSDGPTTAPTAAASVVGILVPSFLAGLSMLMALLL